MNYMANQTGYKAQGAVAAGANPTDVMAYMANLPNSGQSNEGILGKTSDVIQSIFPDKNIGSILGTVAGGVGTALTDPKDLPYYDWNPHASITGVAGDVAGDAVNLGSLLMAPETGGTSLLARSAVNAGIGGALSLANSASTGQSFAAPSTWENAGGAATLSSIFPFLGKSVEALSEAARGASGVTPQIENVLKSTTPQELNDYIQTTLAHNKDLNTPTAIGLASSKLNDATDAITAKLKTAGAAVGSALKQTGSNIIGTNPVTNNAFTDDVLSSFNKKLEETFGHEVTYNPEDNTKLKINGETVTNGQNTEPNLEPLEGRGRTIAPADQKRILTIHSQLAQLADNPTVAKASDIVHNLDDLIDYSKVDQVGINHDPLQGIIYSTRGELNGAIRTSSPAMAAANDRFSQLKGIEEGIGQMAGKDMQRGDLLMRRVFSGDKSGQSLQLLNDIKNETGVDLIKHAGLAKFATENFGDASSKTLLQQHLSTEGSIAGGMKRALLSPIKNITKKLIVPDAAKFAQKITQGGQYANIMDELINSNKGRGVLRTYLNNVSAAHPQIGKGIDRTFANLLKNTTGI